MDDYFGRDVAISGAFALVGAPYYNVPVDGGFVLEDAGSAFLYHRDKNGDWIQIQRFVASDKEKKDLFGISVTIGNNYAIVGTVDDSDDANNGNPKDRAGSAYIFENDESGIWKQTQKIVASDRKEYSFFGWSVAISGKYAVIGSVFNPTNSDSDVWMERAGAAYIFEKDESGHWNEIQKIVASDRSSYDEFGYKVAISDNYLVVTAHEESEDENGEYTKLNAGSAYIFERNETGNWSQTQKIVHSDREAYDNFGFSVAIDNTTIVVGAPDKQVHYEGGDWIYRVGAAYIFDRTGDGFWEETKKISTHDYHEYDSFGNSVSISGDYILASSNYNETDTNNENEREHAGAAYLFKREEEGNWNEVQKIVASDRSYCDDFGEAVAISGSNCIVGALKDDKDESGLISITDAGSAYFFQNGTIGLKENKPEKLIYLFPNPTCTRVNIDLGDVNFITEISVRNIHGKLIYTQQFVSSQHISFDLEGPKGLYLVELKSIDNVSSIIKVMKQ